MNYWLSISYLIVLSAALGTLWRWPLEPVLALAGLGTLGAFIFSSRRWQKS